MWYVAEEPSQTRKGLRAMRMHNAGTGSATGNGHQCGGFEPKARAKKGRGRRGGRTGECWARCGCWPNAVVRPVICRGTRRRKKNGGGHGIGEGKRHRESRRLRREDVDESPPSSTDESNSHSHFHTDSDSDSGAGTDADADPDTDETTLSFALIALRDLRADEEIVLGWEWDDGHAVHMLPALMESSRSGMFGCVSYVSQADVIMVIVCRLRITKEIEPHISSPSCPVHIHPPRLSYMAILEPAAFPNTS